MHKTSRGEKECLLGIDHMSYSLNDMMEIRCIKCNRSEQVYEFKSFGVYRARKVRKTFPEGCKTKFGIVFRYYKTNILAAIR
jgi:hypothetical protein